MSSNSSGIDDTIYDSFEQPQSIHSIPTKNLNLKTISIQNLDNVVSEQKQVKEGQIQASFNKKTEKLTKKEPIKVSSSKKSSQNGTFYNSFEEEDQIQTQLKSIKLTDNVIRAHQVDDPVKESGYLEVDSNHFKTREKESEIPFNAFKKKRYKEPQNESLRSSYIESQVQTKRNFSTKRRKKSKMSSSKFLDSIFKKKKLFKKSSNKNLENFEGKKRRKSIESEEKIKIESTIYKIQNGSEITKKEKLKKIQSGLLNSKVLLNILFFHLF
jgi:hypothetical protein